MRSRGRAGGYTILEVLIVLVITTALFLMVAILFSGRQGVVQTEQSVRDLESKIQNITNDVANGFYPNGFSCTGTNDGSNSVTVTGTVATAGANSGCVFLGKVMALNTTDINIYSVVGWQFTSGGSTSSTLLEARPVLVQIAPETYGLNYGLQPTHIYDMANNTTEYGAIAFLSQLGQSSGGSNPLTGSRSTLLYGVTSSVIGESVGTIASKVGASANLVLLPEGARICLIGGNEKRAEITVGASGSQLSTNVTINNGVSNVCAV